jgi:hypothetical protein
VLAIPLVIWVLTFAIASIETYRPFRQWGDATYIDCL